MDGRAKALLCLGIWLMAVLYFVGGPFAALLPAIPMLFVIRTARKKFLLGGAGEHGREQLIS